MSKPLIRPTPFAKRVPPPAPAPQVMQTRPASTHGRVVILKVSEDGTVLEKLGAPSFLFRDSKALTAKYNLPADHFIQGSVEYLARKAELGIK